ncbi:MAG: hypothetical protein ISP01_02825 [Methanobrevibacter arboriphilus]|uniref:Uncharacterized protein n=1 Tax=Methanobrevibacter arboriphilus TaxID=39441 RepID=A0A843ALA7_METAZ|nr:hypothetical protein [Methanobrevibacter arboriphilus]MBF4468318.1 hypothetical protein [Methanobrevibacter arboriphilus]
MDQKDLVNIFKKIESDELDNGLKPVFLQNKNDISYQFEKIHFIFINKVTLAFNRLQIDENNLRFYIDDEAVSAIAIFNIEEINP